MNFESVFRSLKVYSITLYRVQLANMTGPIIGMNQSSDRCIVLVPGLPYVWYSNVSQSSPRFRHGCPPVLLVGEGRQVSPNVLGVLQDT